MGVIFGVAKKDTTGGSEGVAFFGRNFSRLSFLNHSLMEFMITNFTMLHDVWKCCDYLLTLRRVSVDSSGSVLMTVPSCKT